MKTFPIKLDFVKALTDDVGILQHSKYTTPNKKEGYTTDDNARALIATTNYFMLFNDLSVKKLIETYLSFLLYMQRSDGKMHNYLSYDRQLLDEIGSEDCMGRTLWACGYCLDSKLPEETKLLSKEVFDKLFCSISSFTSPRAKAYSIMGLFHYQKAYPEDRNVKVNINALAKQLTQQFEFESSEEWNWFESYLTYCNARLPHSLFLAYEATGEDRYLQVASKSMKFLINTQTINELFVPIGNRGWYKKGSDRAIYDQQSVEAACTTEATIAAFRNTKEESYLIATYKAFEWFLGGNLQGLTLYCQENGSCCDGITPQGLNQNKGSEATRSYLQARLNLEELKRQNNLLRST
ncbi:glycosyltransferase [Candidatus Bathyarchaeota archaeon]|nr:MAG: glycosyltransferase [Candidatus Bathyarchaeota archaeon]